MTALWISLWIAFGSACNKKQAPDKLAQLRTMLASYFNAPTRPGRPDGLWVATQDSLSAMIEKKYLASYVAKPDEKQASEIRERLKSLKMYFRISGRQVQLATFIADSFGASAGFLAVRPASTAKLQIFDAEMRGKDAPVNAIYRFKVEATGEVLEYEEDGFTLRAVRETENVDTLVSRTLEKLSSGTGLTQY